MGKARVLTLIERVQIIRQYLRTNNSHDLASKFNCHRGQIHYILKHKDEYLAEYLSSDDPTRTRRPRCKVLNALGLILYEWLVRCQQYDFVLSDEMVKQTATEIGKLLKYRLFRPNPKWYKRFRQKYKLDTLENGWEEWKRMDFIGPQRSLNLTDIIDDLRQNFGEDTIPNYIQLEDEEYKDLTVRCYGNRDVAERLGELIRSGETDPEPVPGDMVDVAVVIDDDDDIDVGDSSNSHQNGYASYTYDSTEENYDTISVASDNAIEVSDLGPGSSMGTTATRANNTIKDAEAKAIGSYREAMNALGPLEQFALLKEDVRAVGLINQLEIIFSDRMAKEMA